MHPWKASFTRSRPSGFITGYTLPAPMPDAICSNISRASTIPAACTRLWVISAQLMPSDWRPKPVHFIGGRSVALVVIGKVLARQGAVGMLGFVEYRDVRLDPLLINYPV